MIYIKVYTDKDENGEDILVFDSAKNDNKTAILSLKNKVRLRNAKSTIDDIPFHH